jgi:hypothetical protein
MRMPDLPALLAALKTRAVREADARRILATLGKDALQALLRAAGLSGEIPLAPPQTLASILLHLHDAVGEKTRTRGPKSIPSLLRGSLFESDCPDVKYRFALRREGGADVFVVHAGDGAPRIEREFTFRDEELAGAGAGVPEEQAAPPPKGQEPGRSD